MITLYSNGCPNCKALESILDRNEISYSKVTSMDEIMAVAREHRHSSVPFVIKDGELIPFHQVKNNPQICNT